jgi:hypothetical protein
VIQVDNFKSLLVDWIIGCHALLGYTAIGGWPYDEVNEVTMSPRSELLMSVFLGPTALFVIGSFFFLAGLFAPVEMAHLGPAHFARTRMTRLGLPWLSFALFVGRSSCGSPIVRRASACRIGKRFLADSLSWILGPCGSPRC